VRDLKTQVTTEREGKPGAVFYISVGGVQTDCISVRAAKDLYETLGRALASHEIARARKS